LGRYVKRKRPIVGRLVADGDGRQGLCLRRRGDGGGREPENATGGQDHSLRHVASSSVVVALVRRLLLFAQKPPNFRAQLHERRLVHDISTRSLRSHASCSRIGFTGMMVLIRPGPRVMTTTR